MSKSKDKILSLVGENIMFRMLNKRGQNTAEFAILIGVIVAAAIAMQVYVRRGMQGRIKDAVDYSRTSDPTTSGIFNTAQYEPYYQDYSTETRQYAKSSEAMQVGGGLERHIGNEYISRGGSTSYGNWSRSSY